MRSLRLSVLLAGAALPGSAPAAGPSPVPPAPAPPAEVAFPDTPAFVTPEPSVPAPVAPPTVPVSRLDAARTTAPAIVSYGCRCPACLPPAGISVRSIFGIQVANGTAARMVLYRYEFYAGEPRLTPRGLLRLDEVARRAAATPFPIVVEPTGVPELDEARRCHAAELLALSPWPVPPERVVVMPPPSRGLDGLDAVRVHQGLLRLSEGGSREAANLTPPTAPQRAD